MQSLTEVIDRNKIYKTMEIIYRHIFHPQPLKGDNSYRQFVHLYEANKSPLWDLGVKTEIRYYSIYHT